MREGDQLTGWLRPVSGSRTIRTHRFVDGRALCGYTPRFLRFSEPPMVDMLRCKRCDALSVTRKRNAS